MSLRGKNAVVTGASAGIGRATAIELARRGANLVLAARRGAELESTARECAPRGTTVHVVAADISRREECIRLIAESTALLGPIDLLVNNAGFGLFDSIVDARAADFEAMMNTNYFGTVNCTQAVLPAMIARGSGSIVNIGSIAGLMGYERMGGYCATKFAVTGFTEALRSEVLRHGVKVSLICPGTVSTDFFEIAERGKLPGASRLQLAIAPEVVARQICDAAESGRYRAIMPPLAAVFIRFKELFPRTAHLLMRRVSAAVEAKERS